MRKPIPAAAIHDFVRESNAIESIIRDPTAAELTATLDFLEHELLDLDKVLSLQAVYAPGKPLRNRMGMDIIVGESNFAPFHGSPVVEFKLANLLGEINTSCDPWHCHCAFESLHPFMDGNGRTGRALWAWQMHRLNLDPFALTFLHRFYYQTLEHSDTR